MSADLPRLHELRSALAGACSAVLSWGVLLAAATVHVLSPYWLAEACAGRWAWLATAAICLLLWPLASEQLPGSAASLQFVAALLLVAALARLAASCLRAPGARAASGALDRYALATLAGAHPRRRTWSAHGYVLLHAVSAPIQSSLPCLFGADLRQLW
jgi:hypothetical protein